MFKLFLKSAHPILVHQHGQETAAAVLQASREHYPAVRRQVPDIGGLRNIFQVILVVNAWIISLYMAMRTQGLGPEDTVRVCQQVFDGWLQRLPQAALRATGRMLISAPARRLFEAQAQRSQQRRFPQDFVWRVEQGPAGQVSMIFEECAVNKWYQAQAVSELGSYCNFADITYSRLMGLGLDAGETIGQGCPQCKLRYRPGQETHIPPNLARIFSS